MPRRVGGRLRLAVDRAQGGLQVGMGELESFVNKLPRVDVGAAEEDFFGDLAEEYFCHR